MMVMMLSFSHQPVMVEGGMYFFILVLPIFNSIFCSFSISTPRPLFFPSMKLPQQVQRSHFSTLPSPSYFPPLNHPTYSIISFLKMSLPLPSAWLFFIFPVYFMISFQMLPCMNSPFFHYPLKVVLVAASMKIPAPWAFPSLKLPLQMPSSVTSTPALSEVKPSFPSSITSPSQNIFSAKREMNVGLTTDTQCPFLVSLQEGAVGDSSINLPSNSSQLWFITFMSCSERVKRITLNGTLICFYWAMVIITCS